MLSTVVIAASIALAILIAITHRGSHGPRSRLLRLAVIALLLAVISRELSVVVGGLPWLDLLKRVFLLASETSATLLVLTFRAESIRRTTANWFWAGAGILAAIQAALVAFVPTHADGTLTSYQAAAGNLAAVPYYSINNVGLIAFATVAGVGCYRAARNPRQPATARISMVMLVVGSVCTIVYAVTGILLLTGLRIPADAVIQRSTLLAVVLFLFASFLIGGVGRLVRASTERLAVRHATDIIEPLWRSATAVHPEVVLDVEELCGRDRLIRLAIETSEALDLTLAQDDEKMRAIRAVYTDPAYATAATLLSTEGSGADQIPRLDERQTAKPRDCAVRRLRDDPLARSVKELHAIRYAISNREQWFRPA